MTDVPDEAIEAACSAFWSAPTVPDDKHATFRLGMRHAIEAYEAALWQPIETALRNGTKWLIEVSDSKDSGYQAQLIAEASYEKTKNTVKSEACDDIPALVAEVDRLRKIKNAADVFYADIYRECPRSPSSNKAAARFYKARNAANEGGP